MILIIDNYDSFVHNLARYFVELGGEVRIVRNDAVDLAAVERSPPQAIVISPGPCTPDEAGISMDLVRRFHESIPILGVCLGHQAIAAAFGGKIQRAEVPVHGQTSEVTHDGSRLFKGIPAAFRATRYHSLVVHEPSLPNTLRITARTGTVPMALEHVTSPVWGVQFHPESVLTECGHDLLGNFLRLAGVAAGSAGVARERPHRIQDLRQQSLLGSDDVFPPGITW